MQPQKCIGIIFILKLFFVKVVTPLVMAANIDFDGNLRKILKEIKEETDYKTIFLQCRHIEDCVDPSILRHFHAPTVIWNEKQYVDLLYDYGTQLVVILCMKTIDDENMLQQLAVSIRYMRTARILCIVNESLMLLNDLKILRFFEICAKLEMINILLLHRDSFVLGKFHSYTKFPNFALEARNISRNGEENKWFPDRLKNFLGANLTVIPNLFFHRAFIETDNNGNMELCGCIARFVQTFCEYINASMSYHTYLNKSAKLDSVAVADAIRSGRVDIGLDFRSFRYGGQSRVLEITRLSVTVPLMMVPPISALANVFLNRYTLLPFALQIVVLPFFISKFMQWITGRWQPASICRALSFISDTGLRSFLGQSINMPRLQTIQTRFLFSLLLFGGVIIQTYFAANYARLQTFPPLRPKVANFDDALRSGFKIYTSDQNIVNALASDALKQKYGSLFHEDRVGFQKPLQWLSGDGYFFDYATFEMFVPHSSRVVFNENMDVTDLMLLTIATKDGSALKQPIDGFVDIVQESGLYKYWQQVPCKWRQVKLYDNKYEDASVQRQLKVTDLHGVWLIYIGGHIVCVLVFLCELFGRRFLALVRWQRSNN